MADLYQLSVPVLIRYLGQLDQMLVRLSAFAKDSGRSERDLLALSLSERAARY